MQLSHQFIRYISKVYHLPQLVNGVRDFRDHARLRIPTSAILLAWILAFAARMRSREEIGRWLDGRAAQKLIGYHISSDTLGRVLGQIDTDSLRTGLLVQILRKMRRNKAWQNGTTAGQVLIAIDGSETFSSRHRHCPGCRKRQVTVRQGDELCRVDEYYHQAVGAFSIGTEPRVYLDFEPLRPGEGEMAAATRLVLRLAKSFGRWIVGVVADSYFAGAPFLNQVRQLGWHYVVRVKQEENRHLTRDAQGLAARRPPNAAWEERIGHRRLQVAAWDEQDFTSWAALAEPVRVVICDETELPETSSPHRQVAHPGRQRARAFFATSYPPAIFSTHAVWLAYHRRWHIENNGFRQLKHEWHWDHPFVHAPAAAGQADSADPADPADPAALRNLWLLLAVAANLFIAFVSRRLQSGHGKRHIPMRALAQELAAALRTLSPAAMPRFDTS